MTAGEASVGDMDRTSAYDEVLERSWEKGWDLGATGTHRDDESWVLTMAMGQ